MAGGNTSPRERRRRGRGTEKYRDRHHEDDHDVEGLSRKDDHDGYWKRDNKVRSNEKYLTQSCFH